jgi:glycerol kinase
VTTSDTWLLYQLTGEFVTDASTASRSLVLDLDTVAWAEDLLALFGLDGERLPRIVAGDEVIGTTRAFGAEIPVAGLIVDQPAALVAQHCLEPGTAKCTFGTGAFLLANTGDKPSRSAAGLTSSVAWSARDTTTYCLDGQVYTAASAVRWLRELGLIDDAADLDRVAATESEGVLCVPSLAGLAAPWWQPQATATFTGLSLASGRGQLVLALLEGIAAEVAELGHLVAQDLDQPLRRLRVDGGLTRSARLMQAQADLLQVPVDVFPSANATALGAAALARLALDPSLTLDQAVGDWKPEATYTPRWPADRAQEHLRRWRDVAAFTARNGQP